MPLPISCTFLKYFCALCIRCFYRMKHSVWKLNTLVVSFRLSCPTFYFKFIKLCTLCQLKILLHLLSFWFVSFFKKRKKIYFIHSSWICRLFVLKKKKNYISYLHQKLLKKKYYLYMINQWFVNHVAQCPFRAQVRVIFEKKT